MVLRQESGLDTAAADGTALPGTGKLPATTQDPRRAGGRRGGPGCGAGPGCRRDADRTGRRRQDQPRPPGRCRGRARGPRRRLAVRPGGVDATGRPGARGDQRTRPPGRVRAGRAGPPRRPPGLAAAAPGPRQLRARPAGRRVPRPRGAPALPQRHAAGDQPGRAGGPDERVLPVSPLAVPAVGDQGPADLARVPAVALFLDRTRRRVDGFELTAQNAAPVAEICRRLDGLPLAIELAAARMGSMSPDDLAQRLSWRFRLLRGGAGSASERHRTLGALLDWSYELLDEPHQVVFEMLSVFAGGFDLEDAVGLVLAVPEAGLAADEGTVAHVVLGLADRSMLQVARPGGRTRYVLLESLRDYGRQRLAARDWARRRVPGPRARGGATHRRGDVPALRRRPRRRLDVRHDLPRRAARRARLGARPRPRPGGPAGRVAGPLRRAPDPGRGAAVGRAHDRGGRRRHTPGWPARVPSPPRVPGSPATCGHAVELGERGLSLAGDDVRMGAYLRVVLGEVALFEGRLEDVERFHAEVVGLGERRGAGRSRMAGRAGDAPRDRLSRRRGRRLATGGRARGMGGPPRLRPAPGLGALHPRGGPPRHRPRRVARAVRRRARAGARAA